MQDDHAAPEPFQVFLVICAAVGGAVAGFLWPSILCIILAHWLKPWGFAHMDFWAFLGLALVGFGMAALPLFVQIPLRRRSIEYALLLFVFFCIVGGCFAHMAFGSFLGLALSGFGMAALPLFVQILLRHRSIKYALSFFVSFYIVGSYMLYRICLVSPYFWLSIV